MATTISADQLAQLQVLVTKVVASKSAADAATANANAADLAAQQAQAQVAASHQAEADADTQLSADMDELVHLVESFSSSAPPAAPGQAVAAR